MQFKFVSLRHFKRLPLHGNTDNIIFHEKFKAFYVADATSSLAADKSLKKKKRKITSRMWV